MREQKFKKLAIPRVNKAIKQIRLIGNLSNKNHYEYTEIDAKKIIDALEKEIKEVKSKLLTIQRVKKNQEFSLD